MLPSFSLGLTVVDAKGAVVAQGWPETPITGAPAADRLRATDAVVAEALRGKTTIAIQNSAAQPALPTAAPIRDPSGTIRGALVGVFAIADLHFVDVALDGQSLGHGHLLLISPQDRLFVLSTDPSMVLKPTPAPGVNPLHDRAMGGYRGTGLTVDAKGVEEMSAMASVPSVGWFVVASTPTSEAFSAVGRAKTFVLRGSMFTMLVLLLIVPGLVWWALKPLFEAARQADAMTRGDLPLQPLRVVSDDEVGHLTEAFNRLLAKLASTQRELLELAYHDSLTGLPNRRLLADRLRQAMGRSQRARTRIALMVLDLDGFKRINDAHGHEAGDVVLRTLADRFTATLRRNDTLARLGGDEFVLLASDLGGTGEDAEQAARAIAAKCIAAAARPVVVDGIVSTLGVSIGIALCDGPCDPDRLMDAADQAMYEAKQAGRGRYVVSRSLTEELSAPAAL